MLTVEAIRGLQSQGAIDWEGEFRGDGLLLRLGAALQTLAPPLKPVVDLHDQASIDALYGELVQDWTTFMLTPGQLVLCQASDSLRLGSRVCGLIGTLSHLARVGLMAHLASPFVLPGWDGHVTLELFNAGPHRCGCTVTCQPPA